MAGDGGTPEVPEADKLFNQRLETAIKQKENELAQKSGDIRPWLKSLDQPTEAAAETTPLTPKQEAAKRIVEDNLAAAGVRQMLKKK